MVKANNQIEWKYSEKIMLKLGSTRRWFEGVMRCVACVYFLVIFNGQKLYDFKPTRWIGVYACVPYSVRLKLVVCYLNTLMMFGRQLSSMLYNTRVLNLENYRNNLQIWNFEEIARITQRSQASKFKTHYAHAIEILKFRIWIQEKRAT